MNQTIYQKLTIIEELLKERSLKPLTFRETCTYLGVSSSYLYKLTSTGSIKHYKPTGKLIYFEKKDLDNWLLQSPIKSIQETEQEAVNFLMAHTSKSQKQNSNRSIK